MKLLKSKSNRLDGVLLPKDHRPSADPGLTSDQLDALANTVLDFQGAKHLAVRLTSNS